MTIARDEIEELAPPGEVAVQQRRGLGGASPADLVARYGDAVYSVARNICGTASEAEDVTWNTFVSALLGSAPVPSDANMRAWLCGTAARIALARRPAADHGTTNLQRELRARFHGCAGLVTAGQW